MYDVNRYYRRKWWNEYGIKVKRVVIRYNPFEYWGVIPDRMYILYGFDSYGFKVLLTKEVFTNVEEIEAFLKERYGK